MHDVSELQLMKPAATDGWKSVLNKRGFSHILKKRCVVCFCDKSAMMIILFPTCLCDYL